MHSKKRHSQYSDNDIEGPRLDKRVTGRELTPYEETIARLNTLVEMLDEKGIINKKEYDRTVAMRLHEISKATAFEQMDEEI
jgi:predicted transcriptional regulator YheO